MLVFVTANIRGFYVCISLYLSLHCTRLHSFSPASFQAALLSLLIAVFCLPFSLSIFLLQLPPSSLVAEQHVVRASVVGPEGSSGGLIAKAELHLSALHLEGGH